MHNIRRIFPVLPPLCSAVSGGARRACLPSVWALNACYYLFPHAAATCGTQSHSKEEIGSVSVTAHDPCCFQVLSKTIQLAASKVRTIFPLTGNDHCVMMRAYLISWRRCCLMIEAARNRNLSRIGRLRSCFHPATLFFVTGAPLLFIPMA